MVTLGITGGLGAGKSTAARILEELGAYVFDADKVARDILLTDLDIQEELADEFGPGFISGGTVDTKKLGQIVFADEINQEFINDLIHPKVIDAFIREVETRKDDVDLFVVDAPLIFESGFENHLDYTALIYTKLRIRLSRALARGNLSADQIQKRIALQMSEEQKRELADFTLDNNGTPEELQAKIKDLYTRLTS